MDTKSLISVLPDDVSARIAAGEVIENPASIVRELLDNALDAGADRITVQIEQGGIAMLSVSDNGSGMSRDDLRLSVEKYATSKIRSVEDLSTVSSLGFRGEALFSIAAVSRLEIASSRDGAGHRLICEGCAVQSFQEDAPVQGTRIRVDKLFFNTPARKEFLKSDLSESRAVKRVMMDKMLAFPEVYFALKVDGEARLSMNAASFVERICALYPRIDTASLVEVNSTHGGISVSGYISSVHQNSGSRKDQYCILNKRPVFSPALSRAVQRGYGNQLAPGRYPYVFLRLVMDPALVNINVHPTKREVRFKDESSVFDAVYHAVQTALVGGRFASPEVRSEKRSVHHALPEQSALPFSSVSTGAFREVSPGYSHSMPTASFSAGASVLAGVFAGYRIAGVFFRNYWVLENGEHMLMADQHAVHERVLYDRLKEQHAAAGVPVQGLLVPLQLKFSPERMELLAEYAADLEAFGFGVEPFGPDAYVVQHVPALLKDPDVQVVDQLLDVISGVNARATDSRLERMLATIACRAAVKQGDTVSMEHITAILNDLAALPGPFSCPHGRPTIVDFTKQEVEKWFHRT